MKIGQEISFFFSDFICKRKLNQEFPNIHFTVSLRETGEKEDVPCKKRKLMFIPPSSNFKRDMKEKIKELQKRTLAKKGVIRESNDLLFDPLLKKIKEKNHSNASTRERKKGLGKKNERALLSKEEKTCEAPPFSKKKRKRSSEREIGEEKDLGSSDFKQHLSHNRRFKENLRDLNHDVLSKEKSPLSSVSAESSRSPESIENLSVDKVKGRAKRGGQRFYLIRENTSSAQKLKESDLFQEASENEFIPPPFLPKTSFECSDREVNVFLENCEEEFILQFDSDKETF